VAYASLVLQQGADTIRNRISGIRWWHGVHPSGPRTTPAPKHPAIAAALNGVARRTPARKHRPGIFLSTIAAGREAAMAAGLVAAAKWRGIMVAYFFLLRASEIWAYDDGTTHEDFCLLAGDVTFFSDGLPVTLATALAGGASAVRIFIRGSKADQRRKGTYRLCTASGGGPLDPVRVLAEQLNSLAPCARGATPLMAVPMGSGGITSWRTLRRCEVVPMIKRLAAAQNLKTMGMGTHAMRVGAATSMALAGVSERLIMQAGRWASDAYKAYIKDNLKDAARITNALARRFDVAMALVAS
jgi:hypothetical protein